VVTLKVQRLTVSTLSQHSCDSLKMDISKFRLQTTSSSQTLVRSFNTSNRLPHRVR
jgi:hypothetical protein